MTNESRVGLSLFNLDPAPRRLGAKKSGKYLQNGCVMLYFCSRNRIYHGYISRIFQRR